MRATRLHHFVFSTPLCTPSVFFIDLFFFTSSLLHDLDFMDGISVHTPTYAHNPFENTPSRHDTHTPAVSSYFPHGSRLLSAAFRHPLFALCLVFHAPHIIALLMHSKYPTPHRLSRALLKPQNHTNTHVPHSLILDSLSSHCTLDITHTSVRSYIRPL